MGLVLFVAPGFDVWQGRVLCDCNQSVSEGRPVTDRNCVSVRCTRAGAETPKASPRKSSSA